MDFFLKHGENDITRSCRATAIEYTCTKFGIDSSSRFPIRARTNRQTDATERPTHAGGYTVVGVSEIHAIRAEAAEDSVACLCADALKNEVVFSLMPSTEIVGVSYNATKI